jgi:beta-N-acetylhexosaminidase
VAKLQRTSDSIHKKTLTAVVLAAVLGLISVTFVCDRTLTTAGSPPDAAPPREAGHLSSTGSHEQADASQPLGWGPQKQDADAAIRAVASMTLEQKAGQVLLPFYTGLDEKSHAATVQRLHLAGSIIMGDNVPKTAEGQVDTAAMAAVAARLKGSTQADGRTWPGLIGIDQEGGLVARLRAPLTEWPAPMSYGAAGNPALAGETGKALASELGGLGFNVDFAPDMDVTAGPQDPTIGARSMSGNPDAAAGLGVAFSQGMLAAGMLPTVKHFPGHGSVTVDSHENMPVQNATLDQLRNRDWKPFQAAVGAGLPMIMTGHIAVPALEPGVPASLSKQSYAALRAMGFKGVAVTDALNMGAIQKQFPGESAAPLALGAGADLLLMPGDVAQAHASIITAVKAGTVPAARLDEAATRVVTMLIWRARAGAPQSAAPGSGSALSQRTSAAALTVLAGPCHGPMVPGSVRVAGGSEQDRARFAAAAKAVGIGIGDGPLVRLIGYQDPPAAADVAVALDAPWPLADSAAPAKVALYGRSQEAFNALLTVLAGKRTAPGKLPAAVGHYAPGAGCG